MQSKRLILYLQQGVEALLEQGCFDNGWTFRPTQRQALEVYYGYLTNTGIDPDTGKPREELSVEERLKGFFEVPTGVGKTAIFVGVIDAVQRAAAENDEKLRTVVVVPTVDLLHQTQDAFVKFAPEFKKKTGLYGDGHKSLKRPVTIMTYDAWGELSQSGVIGSHNVDILISDEGHRGTSDQRIENIQDAFNRQATDEATAQVSFTATASFSEDKSVENSHGRRIFYKSAHDALVAGELAAYVQSQRLIIRVDPPEHMVSKEFKSASSGYKISYMRKLKQDTWNKYAFEVFKSGVDERTGDPLSDNQTGFFTNGTKQADDLADMLNGDTALQEKARKMGYKDVAISIHTNGLSRAEQKRRFNAYLANEYLAVVGDEKFKEGFDHPPMKTIIDYPHHSLVDKAQILGRGLRKWWNKPKSRFEGMTIIDTVIYIGSNDSKIDERFKMHALKKAVSVKQILTDTYVLGPAEQAYDLALLDGKAEFPEKSSWNIFVKPLPQGDFNIRIFDENGSIDDYEGLDEGLIEVLNDVLKDPKLIKKPKYKKDLIRKIRLSVGHIKSTISSPNADLFKGDTNAQYVVDLEEMYHIEDVVSRGRKEDWVEITDEDKEKMWAEAKRTGLRGKAVFNHIPDPPEGLDGGKVGKIVFGETKFAPPSWVKLLLDAYAQQPDAPKVEKSQPISAVDVKKLDEEVKRTGLKGTAVFNHISDPPEGLDGSKTERIVSGKMKFAPPSYLKAIFDTYAQQPDAPKVEKSQPISAADVKKLDEEAKRTGVGGKALFSRISDPPEGLDGAKAGRIVGKPKFAPPLWVKLLLDTYAQQPDAPKVEKSQPISAVDVKKLDEEVKRTGLKGRAVFNHIPDPPEGLDGGKVQRIVSGEQKFAPPSYLKAIFDTYAQQPDAPKVEKSQPISAVDVKKLDEEAKRTGLKGVAVFNRISDPPEGFDGSKAGTIVSGKMKSAPPSYLTALFDTYAQQPDAPKVEKSQPISAVDVKKLDEEAKRTGLKGIAVFNRISDPPEGLDGDKALQIISGKRKSAPPSYLTAIFDTYASLPDKKENKRKRTSSSKLKNPAP